MQHELVRARVIEKSPVLGEILTRHGSKTLFEYFSGISSRAPSESYRTQPAFSALSQMITELIGPSLVAPALEELRNDFTVSTADHHGPLTHPFFVGSNIARTIALREKDRKYIFVFACGGISLGNSSFPRGLMFHGEGGESQRVYFAPWRDRRHPVYGYPAYVKAHGKFPSEKIRSIYDDKRLTRPEYYADQITDTNHALWKELPGFKDMHLLYLQQEDFVNKVLTDYHLPQKTVIYKLLTDARYLAAYQRHFNGVKGAFSEEAKGTFLFWALRKGRREVLRLEKDSLVNGDKSYILPLAGTSIIEAVGRKEIFPSMALMYIVCAFYHGFTCLGGFSQVTYLGKMKDAYLKLLSEVEEHDEWRFANSIKTDILCGDLLFTYMRCGAKTVPATPIDIIDRQDPDIAVRLLELVQQCTLIDALDQMMPELHKIYYGELTLAPPFAHPLL